MKKASKIIIGISSIFLFGFGLVGCNTQEETSSQVAADETLDSMVLEDFHVTYNGKEHHISDAGFKIPIGVRIDYGSDKKYVDPGTYTYHLTITHGDNTRTADVNLVIEKIKPQYTGKKAIRVFLDERDDFDVSFNVEGVELKTPIHLTETGDYKYTLETKESKYYTPIDPVEIQLYVREKHYKFGFDNKHVVYDGSDHKILLEEKDSPLDTNLFDVVYTNNEGHSELGKYHISVTLTEKSNGVVYDTYRAILTIDNGDYTAFDTYVDKMFIYFMGGDQLTANILIGDYESFGLEHVDADWYSFERFSDEDYAHDVLEVKELREEFNKFDKGSLSNRQLVDYELIDEMILEYEDLLADKDYLDMRLTYVDQYGGYCAELPSEIEGFHIKNREDLDDMVHLLGTVYSSFMTYYDYIEFREEANYPLNEYTLTNFIEYLDGVVESFDDPDDTYYLVDIVKDNILSNDELQLTEGEKESYVNTITTLFNEDYYNAHKDLRDKTQKYLDDAKKEGGYLADKNFDNRYLGQYEKGQDLYLTLLRHRLGLYNLDPEEYLEQIDGWLTTYVRQWSSLSKNLSNLANLISSGGIKISEDTSFEGLLDYLKAFAKTVVADLDSDPAISVAWMDETVTENTTTAAYYMKSPLSESGKEYIHLNEKSLGRDYLNTISTLSHEGYPGHLYAYVNVKENENLSPLATVSTNTTHGEGWATYVQIELNNYIAETKKGTDKYEDWKMAMDYTNANDLMSYLLYTRCDFAVNYEGADAEGLKIVLDAYGLSFRDDSTYEELFHTFNENPAQYPAYGFGKAYFWQIHQDAQEALGEAYNVVDFNKMLLEHGWCSIDRLERYYDEYMEDALFYAGLAD